MSEEQEIISKVSRFSYGRKIINIPKKYRDQFKIGQAVIIKKKPNYDE